MKLLLILLALAVCSCNVNKSASFGGAPIGLRSLNHYYLKNTVALNSSYNGIVVSDIAVFNNFFYCDRRQNAKIIRPDFSGQVVVALAFNAADNSKIIFTKAENAGKQINVYGNKTSIKNESESPVAIAVLPKNFTAKNVNFYIDGNLVETVSLLSKSSSNIFVNSERREKRAIAQKLMRKKIIVLPVKLSIIRAC